MAFANMRNASYRQGLKPCTEDEFLKAIEEERAGNDGESFEMEVHLVHQNAGNDLAVVGLFITQGAENGIFKEAFEKLPPANSHIELETPINLAELFDPGVMVYRYDGSMTTPPCTEGVKRTVSGQVLELSAEQIGRFKAIYNGNNRPVQPLNGCAVCRIE